MLRPIRFYVFLAAIYSWAVPIAAESLAADPPSEPKPVKAPSMNAPPLTFKFLRRSGPPAGETSPWDGAKEIFRLHVDDIARFEIAAVADDLASRPVVLQITGMIVDPEGPLTMSGEHIPADKRAILYHTDYDKTRYRIERKDGVTTIEFLPEGKKLLKPGVMFQYIDFYR